MGIGLSGLISGMDTDSVVEALVMQKTEKKNQLVKAQKKLEWKQDAWKTLNSKIYNFYTKSLSTMRLIGSYNKKTTSVSNPNVAKITANSGSVNGTQRLGIRNLAKAGYLTGGEVETLAHGKVSNDTKLSEMGVTEGSINITVGGKESIITIDGDTTVKDFVTQLQNAGVDANFDAENQRFFISAKDSGEKNDFSLTAAGGDGIANLRKLGLYTGPTKADVAQYRTWSGYSQAQVDALIEEEYNRLLMTYDGARETFNNEIKSLQTSNENLSQKVSSLEDENEMLGYKKEYAQKYIDGTSAAYYEDVKDRLAAYNDRINKGETLEGADKEEYDKLNKQMKAITEVDKAIGDGATVSDADRAKYVQEQQEKIDKNTASITEYNDTIKKNNDQIAEKQAIISSDAELQKYVDGKNQELHTKIDTEFNEKWDTAKNYMIQYNYKFGTDADKAGITEQMYEDAKNAIGDILLSDADKNEDGAGAVRIEAEDAEIELNGAKFKSSSNVFNINGLTITAQELTGEGADGKLNTVSITTSQDTEGVYNMVKDFLKEYNALINEMDKLYNADSSKGYDPLTDEQKAQMSDKDIELWENKIKSSILRRDSSLNSIIQVMKTSLAGGVTIDGKKAYLSEFGIQTGGYLYAAENERGAYHINGDADDELFASKADQLMAAITNDPDRVAQVLSGITDNLYNNMTKAMRSTSLSSSYTAYNDKQMKEEYDKYTEKIAAQETKIKWWEDYYRSKFTAMEKMLASLNQQQSSLSGLFGS